MPSVRTSCPTCSTVIVDAGELTLRRRPEADSVECSFTCPDCVHEVVQPLSDKMVPVLIGAGCKVEDWDVHDARLLHPSSGGRITEAEIVEFRDALDAEGWMDELLAS